MRTPLATLSSPRSIVSSPAIMRNRVVLPAPLRPAIVSRSRRSSLNETPPSRGLPAMSLRRSEAINRATGRMVGPAPSYKILDDMRRLLTSLIASVSLLLVLAPSALAYNDGRGWYGATNDKVVTNAGFILIIFFPTFVLLMSLLQWRLDKRKEARKSAQKARLGDARWRGGW